jgi:FkbM family methyltransferase
VYNGQEVDCPIQLSFFKGGNTKIDWTKNAGTTEAYKKLINFHRESDAVQNGSLQIMNSNPDILIFKRTSGTEEVVVKPLDVLGFDSALYNTLVMDVQGFEDRVLKGATQTLNQIDYIYTEVNRDEVYENCARVEQLDEYLTDFTRVETNWGGGTWGDAWYIRKSLLR